MTKWCKQNVNSTQSGICNSFQMTFAFQKVTENHLGNNWPSSGVGGCWEPHPEDPESQTQASGFCPAVQKNQCHFFFFLICLLEGIPEKWSLFCLFVYQNMSFGIYDLNMTLNFQTFSPREFIKLLQQSESEMHVYLGSLFPSLCSILRHMAWFDLGG